MKKKTILLILFIFILLGVSACKKEENNEKEITIVCTINNDDVSNGYRMKEIKEITYKKDMTTISATSTIDIEFLNKEAKNAMSSVIESYENLKEEYNIDDEYNKGIKIDVDSKDNKFNVKYTYNISEMNEESIDDFEFADYIKNNNIFDINTFKKDFEDKNATCISQ